MNWLAHLLLSEPQPEFRLGNLLADLVKGQAALQATSPEFRRGVQCHLAIDAFTDFHPVVQRSRQRIAARHNHFSGILMDVFYDHFLARNWQRFAPVPLDDFVQEVHASIQENALVLPTEARLALMHIIVDDRLRSYREVAGIREALHRLSLRISHRLRRPVFLDRAVAELTAHQEELEGDFLEFFPLLQAHVAVGTPT